MRRDGHEGNGTMAHQNNMIIPHSLVDPDLSFYNVSVWRIHEANINIFPPMRELIIHRIIILIGH